MSDLHPLRHNWLIQGDHVTEQRGKKILVFRREERCEFCARERLSKIDAVLWEVMSRRYRGENVPMEERSESGFELATEILATTTSPELRAQILAERNRKGRR